MSNLFIFIGVMGIFASLIACIVSLIQPKKFGTNPNTTRAKLFCTFLSCAITFFFVAGVATDSEKSTYEFLPATIALALITAGIAAHTFGFEMPFDNKSKALLKQCDIDRTTLQTQADLLKAENEQLAQFKDILNVQEECEQIKAQALKEAEQLKNEAIKEAEQAAAERLSLLEQATNQATQRTQRADDLYKNAQADAARVLETAKHNAQLIAADALQAKGRAKEYEDIALAMRNIIEGYGDQYIIPTFTLLDDLANEFGHTQAGQALKEARQQTRSIVKFETAADCDYSEPTRRQTAISFVLDAFNGKVDTILAEVKRDNFGTLNQKIQDAFQIVNKNGAAFRNARITKIYLNARQDELKWATITHELKQQELEEQRNIKAQMREEERAMREYAKAMKDAQKEEDLLKRMIEKATAEIANATEETRARHAQQLIELEARLKEAEEKNQRALSMAQQTKAGNVYVISNIGAFGEDVFKIGMTRRLEPLDRVKELGDASVPFEFDVHAMIYSDDAPKLEKALHHKFVSAQINKVNPRKEFFKINLNEIKQTLEEQGMRDIFWTMTAQAKEYRESLVIAQQIETNANAKAEWEAAQFKAEQQIFDTEDA